MNRPARTILKITICDDSSLARKQLTNIFKDWEVEIYYAVNGQEAIDLIRQGHADLLLLDLNMPVMDGYQVLQIIKDQQLQTKVIVVSGDIQKKAKEKILSLGALAFIVKPLQKKTAEEVLTVSGIADQAIQKHSNYVQDSNTTPEERLQEIANIATGKTASSLADLFNHFVHIAIPKVSLITDSDLFMMVKGTDDYNSTSAITQGFVAEGIRSECILTIDKMHYPAIEKILGLSDKIDNAIELDILIDLAGILSGSFMSAFFNLLGSKHIHQSIPTTLNFEGQLDHLKVNPTNKNSMAIEIGYHISELNIQCDLLVLFTLDSLALMNDRTGYYSWPK